MKAKFVKEELSRKDCGGSTLSAAKRIYKRMVATGNQKMQMTWIDNQNRHCFCDFFMAVRLLQHIDCIPIFDSDEVKKGLAGLDLDKFINSQVLGTEFKLPDISEIKIAISTLKAQGIKSKSNMFTYNIPNTDKWVNPQYLLDIVELLPDAKMYSEERPLAIISFKSEKGDAVLCPKRHTEA